MTGGQSPRLEQQYWCDGLTLRMSGSRGLTPRRIVEVATNAPKTSRAGATWIRQKKQELRISLPV